MKFNSHSVQSTPSPWAARSTHPDCPSTRLQGTRSPDVGTLALHRVSKQYRSHTIRSEPSSAGTARGHAPPLARACLCACTGPLTCQLPDVPATHAPATPGCSCCLQTGRFVRMNDKPHTQSHTRLRLATGSPSRTPAMHAAAASSKPRHARPFRAFAVASITQSLPRTRSASETPPWQCAPPPSWGRRRQRATHRSCPASCAPPSSRPSLADGRR